MYLPGVPISQITLTDYRFNIQNLRKNHISDLRKTIKLKDDHFTNMVSEYLDTLYNLDPVTLVKVTDER